MMPVLLHLVRDTSEYTKLGFFFIHMINIGVNVISLVWSVSHPADQSFWLSLVTKTLMLDIACKPYNQIPLYLLCLFTISYHSVTLTVFEGQWKQSMLGLFAHTYLS